MVFRNLPLPSHGWAKSAAEGAYCAFRQNADAFWSLHDVLFREQQRLADKNLPQFMRGILAKRTDIDLQSYDACISSQEGWRHVRTDLEFATRNKIRVTPTVFVNGVRKDGFVSAETIRSLFEGRQAEDRGQ